MEWKSGKLLPPSRGDERTKMKVIEVRTGDSNKAVLLRGSEARVVYQDMLIWGGDFALYTKFQQEHGRWPTTADQKYLRENVRRDAFELGKPLPEDTPDSKGSLS